MITAAGLLTGDLDIEISLYFSGMHRVRTNLMTITAAHLQSVMSKTTADGGGTNVTYIHRDQTTSFVTRYLTNVKKLIYIEDPNVNTSILTHGLEEQLVALFQAGIAHAKEVSIRANAYEQVWQSTDLHPDRITSEMSQIFRFNQSETRKQNNKGNYYSIYQPKCSSLPIHTPLDVRIRTLFTDVCVNVKNKDDRYELTNQNAVSESDIQKAASRVSIEGVWEGKKFRPKAFKVFQLVGITDRLQVAIISKQLLAEKANGAVIRRVGAFNLPTDTFNLFPSLDNETLFASLENISILSSVNYTNNENSIVTETDRYVLTGEIKLYSGSSPPPSPWLLCNGSILSRLEYPRLFSVIGTKYDEEVNSTTFRLPDLRGRVPFGADPEQGRLSNASGIGMTGGRASQTLDIEQLPSHAHGPGTFQNTYQGEHTHSLYDPGHNHGGSTNTYAVPSQSSENYGEYIAHTNGFRQWQAFQISSSYTQISLYPNGNHTHLITGHSDTVGQGQPFSILPPYQTFYYIIYAD